MTTEEQLVFEKLQDLWREINALPQLIPHQHGDVQFHLRAVQDILLSRTELQASRDRAKRIKD